MPFQSPVALTVSAPVTIQLSLTFWPTYGVLSETDSFTLGFAPASTLCTATPVDTSWVPSPRYAALRVWLPSPSDETLRLAVPPLSGAEPSRVAPSRNSTVPVGVAPPATTALSVVVLESSDGLGFVVSVVVVEVRTVVVPGPSKVTLNAPV